jgi:hypothetical protein
VEELEIQINERKLQKNASIKYSLSESKTEEAVVRNPVV